MVPAKMRGLINGVLAQDHLTVVPAALHPVVSKWIIRTDILSNSLVLLLKASLVAQMVKSLPAVQDTWVRSLGQEESPGGGHGNPLQYCCLENPMHREV